MIAVNEPPNCAACHEHCNIECACGGEHHYCGCECHLRQERWALEQARTSRAKSVARPTSTVRSWRTSGTTWFWNDSREDFGCVFFEAGKYVATTVRGTARFEALDDAKDFVEEHSS